MLPEAFRLGPLHLHPYGLLLALAFLVALFYSGGKIRKRTGVDQAAILDLFQIILISSILGARLFFVVFHWHLFADQPLHVLAIWEGGMTLYGGILLPILAVGIYIHRKGLSFLDIADGVAPSLALGIAIGRLGCFLRGCCFGLPTDSSLGMKFPAGSEASEQARLLLAEHGHHLADLPLSPAIHPSQLYSSFGGLLIFVMLLVLERVLKFRGVVFAEFLVLYGIHRIIMDHFRYYDAASSGFAGLTVSQWVSVTFIVAGLAVWIHALRVRKVVP